MGQIREDFILTDDFSATFSRFLQMGQGAVDRFGELDRSNREFAQSTAYASRMLDSMGDALAAQQMLHTAQSQRLEAQGQKVQELSEKYRRLAADRGEDAAATLKAGEALARARVSEQALLQQSLRTEEAISRQSAAIQEFTSKLEAAGQAAKPMEVPVTWKSDSAEDLIGTGLERFKQKAGEIEDVLKRLAQSQYVVTQQANESSVLPPQASYEVQMLENRIASLGDMITRLKDNPVDIGTAQVDSQLEKLKGQLDDSLHLQERLGSAMEGTDLSKVNEAYLNLSRNISAMERDLKGSFAQPVEIPVTWKTDDLKIFTTAGADRFRDELESVNDLLSRLGAAQEAIGQRAQGISILPEQALEDMNTLTERLGAVRSGIERLGGASSVPGVGKINSELEQLRGQLSQALKEQELLNEAVAGMDVQAANDAYLRLSQTIGGTEKRIRDNIDEIRLFDGNIKDANETCIKLLHGFDRTGRQIEDNVDGQERFNRELKNSGEHAGRLLRTVGSIAATYATIQTLTGAMGLSDQLTSTSARLGMVIDQVGSMRGGLQTVEELQDMIFQSAERSRGVYQATADAVSKLGLMAGEAFSGTEEIVAFMEQINKQFTIAGTEASGIQAAMLQLTQAMGSGVLRGEEYNSILEQAPNIIQNIAGYIEDNEDVLAAVADGMKMKVEDLSGNVQKHLKDIAGEGLLSAELIKAAMFWSADETNRKFESMPKTFGQIWTSFQNHALKAFEPVFEKMSEIANSEDFQNFADRAIGTLSVLGGAAAGAFDMMISGASWAADNLGLILPVLAAIGIAYGIVHGQALLAGAVNVASALASAAAWSVVHWPILLIAAAITGALMQAQAFGFGMEEVGEMAGAAFGMIYSVGYNTFANLWNLIASFAEFFANVWNDPLAATARLFFDVFDSILGIVETVAGAIDSLLGSNMSGAVAGFRGKMSGWISDTFGENAVKIQRMANLDVKDTVGEWGDAGSDLGSKLDNMDLSLKSMANGLDGFEGFSGSIPAIQNGAGDIGKVGSVGNVKNVEGEIRLADEDVRLYRDLAERRYMNQVEVKTLAPTVHVSMPAGPGGSTEPKAVAEEIRKMLIEQMAAQTAVSHG